jgi:hypothetical protein
MPCIDVGVQNLVHKWTYTTLMIESNLHFRVLQNKLTAELPKYLDIAKTELEHGWLLDIPQPDGMCSSTMSLLPGTNFVIQTGSKSIYNK